MLRLLFWESLENHFLFAKRNFLRPNSLLISSSVSLSLPHVAAWLCVFPSGLASDDRESEMVMDDVWRERRQLVPKCSRVTLKSIVLSLSSSRCFLYCFRCLIQSFFSLSLFTNYVSLFHLRSFSLPLPLLSWNEDADWCRNYSLNPLFSRWKKFAASEFVSWLLFLLKMMIISVLISVSQRTGKGGGWTNTHECESHAIISLISFYVTSLVLLEFFIFVFILNCWKILNFMVHIFKENEPAYEGDRTKKGFHFSWL